MENYISREERNGLTQELLKSIFDYHEDGYLYLKNSINPIRCGSLIKKGENGPNYFNTHFRGSNYKSSRLIFLWHKGWLPPLIDHENRISTDDRILNLRPATLAQNAANRTKRVGVKYPYIGVCFYHKKWTATVQKNRKNYAIKSLKTIEEAALAYNKLAVKHHGEFANLNILPPPPTI